MKIAVGCDPNAADFKKQLIPFIVELGHEAVDFGSDDPIYANTAIAVAKAVAAGECDRGVLICGTGIGVSIAANKVKGAYAALVSDVYQAQRAQLSNNANIITMGAQVTGIESAKCFVKEYLGATFDPQSRSVPKVQRIYDYEQEGRQMDSYGLTRLKLTATNCRLNVLRMLKASGHGHVGGAFSAIDIVTALYFYRMRVDPDNPRREDRDRFLLSAGHKCLAQYSVLAERGFFPKEILDTYGSLGSHIPGHPDMHKLPGVEANTGALGHGLSIAVGMALSMRLDRSDSTVYVVMGDGELAEGSNWEAAAAAAHYKLSNLVLFVDFNGLQISGPVQEIMNMTPIAERFKAFGWAVRHIDGNSMEEVVAALDELPLDETRPTAIVAHTVKAKGLSFGENQVAYHFWTPAEGQLEQAECELRNLAAAYEKELKEAGK